MKIFDRILYWLKAPFVLLDHLIEERRLIRRLLVLWSVCLITVVTLDVLAVMRKMEEVTTPVTSFYLGVTALLTAVIGFYQFMRQQDDNREEKRDATKTGDREG
jgi:hypothetical protein